MTRNEVRHDGKKRDNGKIHLRVVMQRARHELNDFDFHEYPSQTAMAINPTSASEIRYAVIGYSLKKCAA